MSKASASIDAAFGRTSKVIEDAIARGVEKAAEFVLEEARRRVPFETGALSASGHVVLRRQAQEVIGYVIFDTPYAAAQHENPDFKHDAGRSFKYLERAALENKQAIEEIIAEEIRRALR